MESRAELAKQLCNKLTTRFRNETKIHKKCLGGRPPAFQEKWLHSIYPLERLLAMKFTTSVGKFHR